MRYAQTSPIRDLTAAFDPGATAIMGPSGSGKSSLLRVLGGTQVPQAGSVTIDRRPVQVASWRAAADPRVVMVHQDYRLVDFLCVEDNLRLAAEARRVRVDGRAPLVTALEDVGLSAEFLVRRPSTLSGGEQQRVAIARALIVDAQVILADEPTGALDAENSARVAQVLRTVAETRGITSVVATHDIGVARVIGRTTRLVDGALCPGE